MLDKNIIYVVSGLPRSGTSMMMNILFAGGMDILSDNIRRPDQNNPRGYWEYEPVKNLTKGNDIWLSSSKGKFVKIISYLLTYLPSIYDYKIIFMERNIEEIIQSQEKMMERDKIININENPNMHKIFLKHIKQTKKWLDIQPNINVLYINYNKLIDNPSVYLKQISDFLIVDFDESNMIPIIDNSLYRQRINQ